MHHYNQRLRHSTSSLKHKVACLCLARPQAPLIRSRCPRSQAQSLLREQSARVIDATESPPQPRDNDNAQGSPHNDQSTPRRGRPPRSDGPERYGDDLDLSYFANANPVVVPSASVSVAPAPAARGKMTVRGADPASQAYADDLDALREVFAGQLREYQASLARVQAELHQLKSARAAPAHAPATESSSPPPTSDADENADAAAAADGTLRVLAVAHEPLAGPEGGSGGGDGSVNFSAPSRHDGPAQGRGELAAGGGSRQGPAAASTSRIIDRGHRPLEDAGSRLNRTRELLLRCADGNFDITLDCRARRGSAVWWCGCGVVYGVVCGVVWCGVVWCGVWCV